MTFQPLAAGLLAAAAFGLAACGDEGSPAADAGRPSSGGSSIDLSDSKTKQAELKFARCMREQGVEFPDPGSEEGGLIVGGDGDDSPEEFAAAEKACAEFRKDIKPPQLSDEQRQEIKDASLAHARCMREHGIDFPDPKFSEDGGATVKIGAGGVDPHDADFKAAEKACADVLPQIGGER